MLTEYRTMLAGMVGVQAAALAAAVTTTARLAEFALREGEQVATALLETLRAPQNISQSSWENAILLLYDRQAEFLRGLTGMPRLSLLIFLGELDQIRGRRGIPQGTESSDEVASQPFLVSRNRDRH
jgi:hypothetical protein